MGGGEAIWGLPGPLFWWLLLRVKEGHLEDEPEIEDEPRLIEDALLVEPGEAIWIFCAASTKSCIYSK